MLVVAIVLCSILAAVMVYQFVFDVWKARIIDVSLSELEARPRDFDGFRVRLYGYIAVGDPRRDYRQRYFLVDANRTSSAMLTGDYAFDRYNGRVKKVLDLEPYVSYYYDLVSSGIHSSLVYSPAVPEPQLVEVVGSVWYDGPWNTDEGFDVCIEKLQLK